MSRRNYLKIFRFRESVLKLILSFFLCLIALDGFGQSNSKDSLYYFFDQAYQQYDQEEFEESYNSTLKLLKLSHQAKDTLFTAEAYFLFG